MACLLLYQEELKPLVRCVEPSMESEFRIGQQNLLDIRTVTNFVRFMQSEWNVQSNCLTQN